jgi:hypothetical protein
VPACIKGYRISERETSCGVQRVERLPQRQPRNSELRIRRTYGYIRATILMTADKDMTDPTDALIAGIPRDSAIWLAYRREPRNTVVTSRYLPADYQECATCGFNHCYEHEQAQRHHFSLVYRIADWRVIGVGLRDSKLVHAPMPELEYQRLVSDVLRIQRERESQAKAQAAANAEAGRLIRRESALRSILGDRRDTTKSEEQ